MIELSSRSEIPQDRKVVIDFYADWCGPCRRLTPELQRLSEIYSDILFVKVNVDDSDDLAREFSITAMPTVLFMDSGSIVHKVIGFNVSEITNTLKKMSKT